MSKEEQLKQRLQAKLKELDDDLLKTQNDYIEWAAKSTALLGYNPYLQEDFRINAAYLSIQGLSGAAIQTRINAMRATLIGAIEELDIEHVVSPSLKEAPLVAPEKVTLKWLYTHVPALMWVSGIGVLLVAFGTGVAVGQSDTYRKHIAPALSDMHLVPSPAEAEKASVPVSSGH